ncbi:MAG: hypothetical protein CMK07_14210 [Ponticaulis sp.]|nr:hypothetical protein [Ponticaulis sp.]
MTTEEKSSAGEPAEKQIYRVHIKAPIETVWSELVKQDEVLPFFFGAVCKTPSGKLEPGEPMAMQTPNGKFTSVVGKVLEFSPPHRYVHTLKFTQMSDDPVTIEYDLKEVDGGVDFTLTTHGGVAGSQTEKSMAQGSPMIINTLKAMCETGKVPFGTRLLLGMFGLMAPFTPAACKTENWPFDRIEKL